MFNRLLDSTKTIGLSMSVSLLIDVYWVNAFIKDKINFITLIDRKNVVLCKPYKISN